MKDHDHPTTSAGSTRAGAGEDAGEWAVPGVEGGTTGKVVVDALGRIAAELDGLATAPLSTLGARQHVEVLERVTRLQARFDELVLREAAAADAADVASITAAASTAAWWGNATQHTKRTARGQVQLGKRLDTARGLTRDALAAGRIVAEQAAVIVAAVDALPREVGQEVIAKAEAHLVAEAAHHDALRLKMLGSRVLDVVAPEVGEEQERKKLEEEERKANQKARFTMSDDGHGTTHGRFTIPTAQAAMLRKQLLAIAAPKHRAATGQSGTDEQGEKLTGPHRMGLAFLEWIGRRFTGDEPIAKAGGLAATCVVTMTQDQLTGDSDAPATLDTGEPITAGQARRLACEAGIIPVVLDGRSQPLDVGRKHRFHTALQRVAIAVRDKTCTTQGCDIPPGGCHVHHDDPWASGGKTSVAKGRLLCPYHHTRAHDPAYEKRIHADNTVTFHRRT